MSMLMKVAALPLDVTEIVTAVDVVVALWLSVATAVSVWLPPVAGVQLMLYGLVESMPIDVAPSKNWTWVTVPSESAAFADTVMATPDANEAPLDGDVMLTVGGVFVVVTVTVTAVDVVVAPRLSVATAVSVWLPPVAGVQLTLYGLVVSVPSDVAPSKNWTWVTVPSESAAFADTVTAWPDGSEAPFNGEVMFTVGGVLAPPVPVSPMLKVLCDGSLLVRWSVADSGPVAVGANWTVIDVLAPGATGA